MFNTPILDIVLGLVFIFLLYSLLATSIKEAIATGLGLRARMLRRGIVEAMLSDTPDHNRLTSMLKGIFDYLKEGLYMIFGRFGEKKGIGYEFYRHPLMKNYGSNKIFSHPSYISADNFSTVLIETLKGDLRRLLEDPAADFLKVSGVALTKEELLNSADIVQIRALLAYYREYYRTHQADKSYTVAVRGVLAAFLWGMILLGGVFLYFTCWWTGGVLAAAGVVGLLVLGISRKGNFTIILNAANEVERYLAYVVGHRKEEQGQAPKLEKETMELLDLYLAKSIYNIDAFSEKLGGWFNDTMDRVSGWYKRQVQVILLIIGFVMAFIFNVDVIEIATRLSKDDKLRDKLVQSAVAYSKAHAELPGGGPDSGKVVRDSERAAAGATGAAGRAVGSAGVAGAKMDSADMQFRRDVKAKFDRVDSMVDHDIRDVNTLMALGYGDYGRSDAAYMEILKKKGWSTVVPFADTKDDYGTTVKEAMLLRAYLRDSLRYAAGDASYRLANAGYHAGWQGWLRNPWRDTVLLASMRKVYRPDNDSGFGAKLDSLVNDRFYAIEKEAHQARVMVGYMWYTLVMTKHKWLGFLLLGFAVCMGAPFWFDLLNKIVNIRATGKKEEDDPAAGGGSGGGGNKAAGGQPVIVNVNNQSGNEEAVG